MTIKTRIATLEREAGPAGALAELDGADRALYLRMARHDGGAAFFRTLTDTDLDRSINILRRLTNSEVQS